MDPTQIETLGRDKLLSLDDEGFKKPEIVEMVTRSRSTTPNDVIISQQHFSKIDLEKLLCGQEQQIH